MPVSLSLLITSGQPQLRLNTVALGHLPMTAKRILYDQAAALTDSRDTRVAVTASMRWNNRLQGSSVQAAWYGLPRWRTRLAQFTKAADTLNVFENLYRQIHGERLLIRGTLINVV